MTAMWPSSWRSPEAGVSSFSRAIRAAVSWMPSAAVFSSTRATRLVPGMGAMSSPWASNQASAIRAGVARASAEEGPGLTYTSEPAVAEPLREGRLSVVLDACAAKVSGLFLYDPSRKQSSPALKLFVEVAKEVLAGGKK
jgi:DNA-binding transcriptional LysR family regulator